jgi:endogenous inhibitor of DNA gyrase (YacG/DUF329 family)
MPGIPVAALQNLESAMPKMVQRQCKNCGDPFTARAADVKRGWGNFCSKTCKAIKQEKRTGQYARHLQSRRDHEPDDNYVDYEGGGWDAHKEVSGNTGHLDGLAIGVLLASVLMVLTGCMAGNVAPKLVSDPPDPSPVVTTIAVAYVQTAGGINVYDVNSQDQFTAENGSPFPISGQIQAATGQFLISLDAVGNNVYLYPVNSDGSIGQAVVTNTQNFAGSECGQTDNNPAVLDRTGQYLYAQLGGYGEADGCTAFQSYQIASNGTLTFLGDTDGLGVQHGDSNASLPPVFDSSNQFGYSLYADSFECTDWAAYSVANGNLSGNANFTATQAPYGDGTYGYTPVALAADSAEHLAVVMAEWNDECSLTGNYALATYNVNPSTGAIVSTQQAADYPAIAVGSANLSVSNDGLFVAAGEDGLQVFGFSNGAYSNTLTANLLPSVQVDQMAWDSQDNLYAMSDESGQLYVYTVTANGATPVSGSPFSIAGASGLVVVP